MKRTIIINEAQAIHLGLIQEMGDGDSSIFNSDNQIPFYGQDKVTNVPFITNDSGDDIMAGDDDTRYNAVHDTDHDLGDNITSNNRLASRIY